MPEHLFDPEQIPFPDARQEGRFMTPSGLRHMQRVALAGGRFARSFPIAKGRAEEMAFHAALRSQGAEALNAYYSQVQDPFCALLMRVAFAIGASTEFHQDDMYGFTGPGTHFLEVMAQRDLALLCRVLHPLDRQHLYEAGEMLGFGKDAWIPMVAGAHAVADFAQAVQAGGERAFLPTAKEDARDGIDILVPLGTSGLCVQVKRLRDAEGITLQQILRPPSGPGSRQELGDPRRTWQGTNAFNRRYKVTWGAATAIVGRHRGNVVLRFGQTLAA